MTLLSRLGYRPVRRLNLVAPRITSPREITVIIPVKNNQAGIDLFLEHLLLTHPAGRRPAEVIIVDNNSCPALVLPPCAAELNARLLRCTRPGPASARNMGARHTRTEWLLFTDSDCIPTEQLLEGFLQAQDGSVGYAGNITSYHRDVLSRYYETQEILLPPEVREIHEPPRPDYLVTANCLVWRRAFELIGGFNESFALAGGEDIDLGFRLRMVGRLGYALQSVAKHNFEPDLGNFLKRFRRYGEGNRLISQLYGLNLEPRLFSPVKKSILNFFFALMQYFAMRKGYRRVQPIRVRP